MALGCSRKTSIAKSKIGWTDDYNRCFRQVRSSAWLWRGLHLALVLFIFHTQTKRIKRVLARHMLLQPDAATARIVLTISGLNTPSYKDIDLESVTMEARHKRTFRIGILAFCISSSLALADTAEEMARADAHYNNMEMMDAAVIFKKLALQNYVPAQTRIGELLDYTESDEEAVGWYIMAAFQGDAEGAYFLGKMYLAGEGIKKDPNQALYWFKFAAEKNSLNGMKALESAYRNPANTGLPVTVDLKQAEYWKARMIPVEEARKKADDEKLAAFKKAAEEKAAARKKADDEAAAAKKAGKGQSR